MENRRKIKNFIKKRPYLIWYVKDYAALSPEAIVEATLNYGDWDDVQMLIKILGMKRTARIFRAKSKPSKMGRQNYRPEIKNYFGLYFNKHIKQHA
ncbi:MAG: hypothetical protein AAB405_00860 [Patescibacteria group bacterium]